jgi:hypothetical protein
VQQLATVCRLWRCRRKGRVGVRRQCTWRGSLTGASYTSALQRLLGRCSDVGIGVGIEAAIRTMT